MKKLILLIGILLGISILYADTHIPGGDVSETWTYANSPYIIDGEINIQVGDELVIEPGVHVIFSGHYRFKVYGRIIAEGTSSDIILFTALAQVAGWYGLRFIDTNSNGQDGSTLIYCSFEYGNATGDFPEGRGGAIRCENSSDILIKNSLINNNTAALDGGGIWCGNYSSPTLINVIISNNVATGLDGGGMFCWNYSNPTLTNVLIYGNEAGLTGGGICCWDWSSLSLTNVTISGNTAISSGGGLYYGYSDYNLVNCILWDNTPDEIDYFDLARSITITYSDIKDGTGQPWFGTGCIDEDPLFVQLLKKQGNYHLSSNSPCINTGDPDTTGLNLPDYDLDGNPRIENGRIDMGVYEFQDGGLNTPQDVIIYEVNDSIFIEWSEVSEATSYKIYSSDDPYEPADNWDFEEEVTEISWSEPADTKKFYYIKAIND